MLAVAEAVNVLVRDAVNVGDGVNVPDVVNVGEAETEVVPLKDADTVGDAENEEDCDAEAVKVGDFDTLPENDVDTEADGAIDGHTNAMFEVGTVFRWSVSPYPSWPSLFLPQQTMPPWTIIAQV